MILRYFSDLHLEFIKPRNLQKYISQIPIPNLENKPNEICILAGDIGYPRSENYDQFMNFISNSFSKTFIIPGNHEYYSEKYTIEETDDFMKNYFQKYKNIRFLNNEYEIYNNYCFIGTTLWSKIINPRYEINDTVSIPGLDIAKYNEMNRKSVDFLENTLSHNISNESITNIIITHHIPSVSLIDPKYLLYSMKPYNQWFYCDMNEFIEKNKEKIAVWIYGHTHTPSERIISGITFLCNPIGYPNENTEVDFSKSKRLIV